MSLLDKASLVLIPSGTKNGTVFCQKPTGVWEDSTGDYDGQDGTGFNGQLDFTRASSATLVNSDGLIEKVRTNILTYSNTFSNGAWTKLLVTVTGGQEGYDGTNNAWLLQITDPIGRLEGFPFLNNLVTLSIYAKAGTTNVLTLAQLNAYSYVTCDLSNGTFTGQGGSVVYRNIESVGNGWYRIQLASTGGTLTGINIAPVGIVGDNVYIQNVQLEYGDIATDYIETTATEVSVGPVSGSPRLDYLDSSYPRLLLEPQRTNSLTYSEQFDNAAWSTSNVSIDSNVTTTTDPSGYNGSRLVTQGPSPSSGSFYRAFTFSATKYTYSIFAKMDEVPFLSIGEASSGSGYPRKSWFNIQNGTLGTIDAAHTAKIENYGNGWYRCSISFTATAGANSILNYLSDADYSGISTSNKGSYFWGAQLEEGSYPTSYIPTLSTTVTRIADACSKTGISDVIGQTEGTLFVDMEFEGYDNLSKWIAFLGTGNSYIGLYTDNISRFAAEVSNSGTSQFVSATYTFSVGQRYKLALAYKANDFAFYVNGAQVATDNSGTIPATSQFDLQYSTTANNLTVRTYNQALLFKTRLTNSELATLTSL